MTLSRGTSCSTRESPRSERSTCLQVRWSFVKGPGRYDHSGRWKRRSILWSLCCHAVTRPCRETRWSNSQSIATRSTYEFSTHTLRDTPLPRRYKQQFPGRWPDCRPRIAKGSDNAAQLQVHAFFESAYSRVRILTRLAVDGLSGVKWRSLFLQRPLDDD